MMPTGIMVAIVLVVVIGLFAYFETRGKRMIDHAPPEPVHVGEPKPILTYYPRPQIGPGWRVRARHAAAGFVLVVLALGSMYAIAHALGWY